MKYKGYKGYIPLSSEFQKAVTIQVWAIALAKQDLNSWESKRPVKITLVASPCWQSLLSKKQLEQQKLMETCTCSSSCLSMLYFQFEQKIMSFNIQKAEVATRNKHKLKQTSPDTGCTVCSRTRIIRISCMVFRATWIKQSIFLPWVRPVFLFTNLRVLQRHHTQGLQLYFHEVLEVISLWNYIFITVTTYLDNKSCY